RNGWIQPTIYQGLYNAIQRAVEPELFPCLRKFGISFYEFNPLGGGFFTGKYANKNAEVEPGSRFDASIGIMGKMTRKRYWNDSYFQAVGLVREVCTKHGLTMGEVALRWLSHHSVLKREYGDSVLVGGSNVQQIQENLDNLDKGPLPEEVCKVLDDAWEIVKAVATPYYH
ncbi:Aldo/keto reductase, partial [Calocera viscosa TUFC12733]